MGNDESMETGCCPPFNPLPWIDKEITWNRRLFVRGRLYRWRHHPFRFAETVNDILEKIRKAKAYSEKRIVLVDENRPFGADILVATNSPVSDADMTSLSGTFLTKVFSGPYSRLNEGVSRMKAYAAAKDRRIEKILFFYTTCPRCAEIYGENYIVILAQVQS